MRCVKFPSTSKGFPVENGSIKVGEEGRGRYVVYIPILNTPNIQRLENAKVGKKEGKTVLFSVSPEEDTDERILALINTAPSYDRHRNFRLIEPENIEIIEEGYTAFGQAGRVNGGSVYLAILNRGWSFGVTEKYGNMYFSEENGKVKQYTPAQWKVKELKNLGEEEIEWL